MSIWDNLRSLHNREATEPRKRIATTSSTDTIISIGDSLAGYEINRVLGIGGFGEVFLGIKGDDAVAIKVAKDPSSIDQFQRFLKVQSRLDSPNVVKVVDSDLDADPAWISMELVDGCTLRDILDKVQDRKRARPALMYILCEIAAGLRDAHEKGVCHLDLKPSNVLISREGVVKLTDFEFSRNAKDIHLSISLATADNLAGTLAYMSPEQRAGKEVGYTSDIYTFGVIMFEVMTGELPQPRDSLSDFIGHTTYDPLFDRCFARPRKRFKRGEDLYKAISAYLNATAVNQTALVDLLERLDLTTSHRPSTVSDELVSAVFEEPPEPEPEPEPYVRDLYRVETRIDYGGLLGSFFPDTTKTETRINGFLMPITVEEIKKKTGLRYGAGRYVVKTLDENEVELSRETFVIAKSRSNQRSKGVYREYLYQLPANFTEEPAGDTGDVTITSGNASGWIANGSSHSHNLAHVPSASSFDPFPAEPERPRFRPQYQRPQHDMSTSCLLSIGMMSMFFIPLVIVLMFYIFAP